MSEIDATVESENVPEPKPFSDRIIQWIERSNGSEGVSCNTAFFERLCKQDGDRYRILRVAPPVERRVGVDWASVVTECGDAIMGPEWSAVRAAIERYPVLRVAPPVERRVEIGESELAKCVNDFAAGMLAKLMTPKNRAKGDRQGWLSMSIHALEDRLEVETYELHEAIANGKSVEEIEDEARDVANFAMMIADKARHARIVEETKP